MDILKTIRYYLFGYDAFISYSRKDSSLYASNLANILTRRKISCFIDQWGTKPGEDLPKGLKRTLSSSKIMVLLTSPHAILSNSVEKEIFHFIKKGKGLIIPIDFDSFEKANWYKHVEGLARTDESLENLKAGISSEEVINRIVNTIGYSTKNRRLKKIAISTLVFIMSVIGISSFIVNRLNEKAETLGKQATLLHNDLDSIQELTTETNHKLALNQKQLNESRTLISQREKEIELKEKKILEIDSTKKRAEENLSELTYQTKIVKEAIEAENESKRNPTKSFSLAMSTFQKEPSFLSTKNIVQIYNSDNIFYSQEIEKSWGFDVSNDFRYLLNESSWKEGIHLIDLINEKNNREFLETPCFKTFFVNEDRNICVLDTSGTIVIYDFEGKPLFQKNTDLDGLSELVYSDSNNIIAGARFDSLYIIDVDKLCVKVADLNLSNIRNLWRCSKIHICDIRKCIYTMSHGNIISKWDFDGKLINDLVSERKGIRYHQTEFSPNGASYVVGQDNTPIIYNTQNGEQIEILNDHEKEITHINFSTDSKKLLISSLDGETRLYNYNNISDGYLKIDTTNRINDLVSFSPNNEIIAIGKRYGEVKLFYTNGKYIGKCKAHLPGDGANKSLSQIKWNSKSNLFITRGRADSKIYLWDIDTRRKNFYPNAHSWGDYHFNQQKNRFIIYKVFEDKLYLNLYDIKGNALLKQEVESSSDPITFSPNGKSMVFNSNDSMFLYSGSIKSILNSQSVTDFWFMGNDSIIINDSVYSQRLYIVSKMKLIPTFNEIKKEIKEASKSSNIIIDLERMEFNDYRFSIKDSLNQEYFLPCNNSNIYMCSDTPEEGIIVSSGDGLEFHIIDPKLIIESVKKRKTPYNILYK